MTPEQTKVIQSVQLRHGAREFLGSRFEAIEYRKSIDSTLLYADVVVVDFKGVTVTTSFVDELLGSLILKFGERISERISFRNCNPNARAMIEYVYSARLRDHAGSASL